ncbi:MAG: alanine--glyoxylate aminotransferase family protein [Candidatus Omnitrophica bacterium]|nr:alanine--glyoxylate aminotransferase family protein [Candidatus Omnitrophota bacterium]
MDRNLLLTPGPTHIPPDLCAALGKPIIHHRTPQFQLYLKEVAEGLQYIFQTKSHVYLLASSGTGTMEAAVANVVNKGDKVITIEGGKFGERWTELCKVYGAECKVVQVKWGTAVDAKLIKKMLDEDKSIKAVFATLNETSTGVTTDIKALGEVVNGTNTLLVVDAISGLGVVDFKMDEWHADICVAGAHKGFMLPPGLGMVAVSDKAMKVINECTSPRYYFDLRKYEKAYGKNDTPFTPAINIIVAMVESLRKMRAEGLDNMLKRFDRLAKGVRAAAKAMNLTLLAEDYCISNALTPIMLPEGMEAKKVVKTMRDVYGVSVAAGQGDIENKIIRISHMGAVDEFDMLVGIGCFEKVMKQMGHKFELGAGLTAAQKVYNA